MKIGVLGASGWIGSAVVREALARGHELTAIVHQRGRLEVPDGVQIVEAEATDPSSVVAAVIGLDAVVFAVSGKRAATPPQTEVAAALLDALPRAGVRRLIAVGSAGGLESAGTRLMDHAGFLEEWKPEAAAQIDALEVFRTTQTDVDWTVFSPAALIEPGPRTGEYRVQGGDRLLTDDNGVSRITVADYAAALVDELEEPQFVRERFTVAY